MASDIDQRTFMSKAQGASWVPLSNVPSRNFPLRHPAMRCPNLLAAALSDNCSCECAAPRDRSMPFPWSGMCPHQSWASTTGNFRIQRIQGIIRLQLRQINELYRMHRSGLTTNSPRRSSANEPHKTP